MSQSSYLHPLVKLLLWESQCQGMEGPVAWKTIFNLGELVQSKHFHVMNSDVHTHLTHAQEYLYQYSLPNCPRITLMRDSCGSIHGSISGVASWSKEALEAELTKAYGDRWGCWVRVKLASHTQVVALAARTLSGLHHLAAYLLA